MRTHRIWTIGTLCWFFVLFNIERILPAVNLASFVYVLSTVAGVSMLALPALRRQPFARTAVGFALVWILGKCMLGYAVHLEALPIALTEVFSLVVSQYLCLKVAQNTDEFEITSAQLLEVLRANSVLGLREAEPQLLDEIRRARRHERPLTFVSLTPGQTTPEALAELVRQMEASMSREYMVGCISRILATSTKSHDLAVRVGDQFLMLLPETDSDQSQNMVDRLQETISNQLGIPIEMETYAFGTDELTLSGVLNRLTRSAPDNGQPQDMEVFELQPVQTPRPVSSTRSTVTAR